jgi:hypothetical protein
VILSFPERFSRGGFLMSGKSKNRRTNGYFLGFLLIVTLGLTLSLLSCTSKGGTPILKVYYVPGIGPKTEITSGSTVIIGYVYNFDIEIDNVGDSDLKFPSTPIDFSLGNLQVVAITPNPLTVLAPNSSAQVTINENCGFYPVGTIQVHSEDPDQGVFTFSTAVC